MSSGTPFKKYGAPLERGTYDRKGYKHGAPPEHALMLDGTYRREKRS